jgi:hypothetical protein
MVPLREAGWVCEVVEKLEETFEARKRAGSEDNREARSRLDWEMR